MQLGIIASIALEQPHRGPPTNPHAAIHLGERTGLRWPVPIVTNARWLHRPRHLTIGRSHQTPGSTRPAPLTFLSSRTDRVRSRRSDGAKPHQNATLNFSRRKAFDITNAKSKQPASMYVREQSYIRGLQGSNQSRQ